MKKQIFTVLLAIIAFFMVIFVNAGWSSNQIEELYIFGDSLSDVGNTSKLTESLYPPSPPYFSGRFSNGRLWVENLAERLQLNPKQVTNLAWGGATAGTGFGNVPGLLTQVQNFVSTHEKVNSQALCVIWIGANDYLYGATNVTVAGENLVEGIFFLVQKGVKKFLIANLPDLGKLPATRNSEVSASLSALTNAHNLNVSKAIEQLKQELNSNLEIVDFDVYSLYQDVTANPNKFNLTNVTDSCLNKVSVCEHPDKFLFWDGIHPTESAHEILGKKAYEQVETRLLSKIS